MDMAVCEVCFHHCHLEEGQKGLCGARICSGGKVVSYNYGKLTSLALDPIEKKPLRRFHPGSRILSIGSFGCNLRCPFCQNYEISWSAGALRDFEDADIVTPEELLETGIRLKDRGNIGIAFTYNEPLIGYEYVRDTAKLFKENGMKTVLVTNGTAELKILEELIPFIDAMNIDLKGFT
ncbi:MAG: radical SAM protein, partial [Erysipelotrichaceae bacterium]|nr:radical SAM protein [Erysipelotrichaceae bacterium]